MAFFALLWKARTIEKYKLNYEKEKINSIVMGNTRMEQTLSQRWRHYRYDTQKRISSTFKKWYPEGSVIANFFLYLKTDQTFPNFLLKSLMGFVGGIILTYICFMFFVFQLSISLIHSTIMSSIIGVLLTLGLAFSYRIRCLVFLLIPQFFSRVGRYTLTCYALVLILTGPATNTLKNSEVLSESMACSQEQIKTSVHHLNDLTKKPHNSMKESIKMMIDRFKVITTRVQQMILRLNRLLFSIVGLIQYSFSWLQAISNICNEKLGSPYDRCTTLLQEGMADCTKNIEPNVAVHYSMAYLKEFVCGAVQPFKTFCCVTDFMDDAILANIRKKLRDFTAQVRALFHVEVHIHRSYAFKSNNTRSASQIAAGIVTEIRNRTGPLLTWLSWSSCVTSLFLLLIIFRAKYYQHMYETRSRFDNRYITRELRELDLKRLRQGRETVLPLNRRERAKYITTTSFRLVASEKMYLTRSAVFMLITTFKLLIHIVADYSLYWVLMTIRYHGQYQSDLMPGVPHSGAHVTGSGFVARLLRSIVDTFTIPLARPAPSLIPCLPEPYPPDFRRYTQIGVLIFLLWFFALFEPYGLRLRHIIMGQYRPERAKARATWLYNHILRTRAGFMKFARRKLHRKYKYSTENSLTFRHWLSERIPFQWLKYLLGVRPQEPYCLLCGTTSSPSDSDTRLTRCETPNCPGVYCTNCFSDIGQLCTICLSPNDYGDLSDLSLERGSSDDDDSGSEFDGNVNINECIKLLENESHERSRRSVGRWNYFLDSQKSGTQKSIPPKESTNTESRNIYIYSVNNGHLAKLNPERQRELQNYCLLSEDDIKIYNFSVDYNNNIFLELPKEKTGTFTEAKSIGMNTEKRYSLMSKMNGNNIFKTITICKKESMKKVKVLNSTLNYKTRHEIDNLNLVRDGRERTKNHIDSYKINLKHKSFQNLKANSKCVMKRKKDVKICVWVVFKVFINIIRILNQRNSRLYSINCNKSEDPNKEKDEHNFKNMKPVMSSTPKSNETKKNVKKSKKKTKDIEKNPRDTEKEEKNNSKKNTSNDKLKKPCKDNSKKSSKHKIAIFHAFFSNHWRTVKSNIGFLTNRYVENVKQKEKKNHKRRKKRKDSNNCTEKVAKENAAKKDSKRTRNYRISAFLADHEWMKRDYKRPNRANVGSDDSCRVVKVPSCRMIPPIRNKTNIVGMVQVDNRPFQWRDNRVTESVTAFREYEKNNDIIKSKSQACLKRKVSVKALERFKRRVNAPEPSPAPSILNQLNLMRKSSLNVDSSSICIKKRRSIYKTFKRDAMKIKGRTLDTVELFKNKGYSDLIIPLEFQSKLSDTNTNTKIDRKIPSSTISVLQKNDSNNTDLGEKTTLMACRFDSFKDILRKWNLINKPREKSTTDKIYDVTQKFKTLCTSLLGSSCDELTCEKRRQLMADHKIGKCNTVITKSSEIVQNNSIVTRRCNCEPYEDIQRKWTHINNSPEACQTDRKLSFKKRIKKLCSSIFASGCNEKTCYNHQERERILNENRLCKKKEIKSIKKKENTKKVMGKDCAEKCPLEDIKDLNVSDHQEREKAKLKEIQRHIEKEKEIEREIALEQKRHREREKEIEKELGYELAKHREAEKKLMCDEDRQTLQGVDCGNTATATGNVGKRCEATTQPSVIQQKSAAVGSVCECVDKQVGGKISCCTPPKRDKRKRHKKGKISCACPAAQACETPPVCCRTRMSVGVGSCNCFCEDKNVGSSKTAPCSCAVQCKTSGIKLSNVYPEFRDLPSPKEITPYKSPTSLTGPKSPPAARTSPISKLPSAKKSPPAKISPPCPPAPCAITPNASHQSVTSGYDCCCTRAYKQQANKALGKKTSAGKKKQIVKCECSTQYSKSDLKKQSFYPMFPKFVSHQVSPIQFSRTSPSQSQLPPKRATISECTSPQMIHADEAVHLKRTKVQKNSGRQVTGEVKTKIIYSHKNNARQEGVGVRNPSVLCLPRRGSPHSQPQQFSAQQAQPQWRSAVPGMPSQQSSISHLSPLLLLTTPSPEEITPRQKTIEQPPMPTKARVSRKRSPLTIRIPVQISDALNLAPRIRDTPRDSTGYSLNKSVFKNKLIAANFPEENLPPKSQFQQIAVQAKLDPEFTNKRSPSSDDYAMLLPSSGVRDSARSKHHPNDIIKFSFKKNRSGANAETQFGNISYRDASQCHAEKREKPKADKTPPHKGTRYNYCWKRFGRKSSVSTKEKENTKLRRLSLESSLCDLDNQSILNDLLEDSDSDIASASCLLSDEGFKTDTTCCSIATVHFNDKRCRRKVKFIANNDQATSTERTVLRDTGTITCDWWSPLVERRGYKPLEKKQGYNEMEDARRGITDGRSRKPHTAEGRFVKFRTGTQIIPPWRFEYSNLNIMTPSRYLLESQKYYNELFAYATNMPRADVHRYQHQTQRVHEREKVRSPIGSRRAYQRKTKRLDECYSSRKSLYSPRRRLTESNRTSDSPRIRSSVYRKSVKRYYAKLNAAKKPYH